LNRKSLRVSKLELVARVRQYGAFLRLLESRSPSEKMFFAAHGHFPENATVSERRESSFETHGLKTTIILERVKEDVQAEE